MAAVPRGRRAARPRGSAVLVGGLLVVAAGGASEAAAEPTPSRSVPPAPAQPAPPPLPSPTDQARPPPLHVDYAQYGIALAADFLADPGAICRGGDQGVPCILGSGGGLVVRGGYRSPGPWYIGGAYQFSKTDSSNLYRLGSLQQLRVEMRYMLDMGYRFTPYATWGIGGLIYGNEFGAETGGGAVFGGVGFELQVSRRALVGMALSCQPTVIAGWTDTADFDRDAGMAQFVRLELQLEIRSQLRRR